MKSKLFVEVKEIREDTGLGKNYIYDLIECKYIKHFWVGNKVRIPRTGYYEFLEWCETHDLPPYEELRVRAYQLRQQRKLRKEAA